MINDTYMIVNLEMDLSFSVPLNYPSPLIISTLNIFNNKCVLEGVNYIHCWYDLGIFYLKGYMQAWVGPVIIVLRIQVIVIDNGLKEYFNLGILIGGFLKLV